MRNTLLLVLEYRDYCLALLLLHIMKARLESLLQIQEYVQVAFRHDDLFLNGSLCLTGQCQNPNSR